MRIEHIALWTHDLERLRSFYETYFEAQAGAKYANARTGFESYFLTFEEGARLEIMRLPELTSAEERGASPRVGCGHLAIAVGSEALVDALTARIKADGYTLLSGPRRTGDGYYESVVLDPDGNRVEITV
ncbi:MAG: VOC family protein [Anaerolineales bacterium]